MEAEQQLSKEKIAEINRKFASAPKNQVPLTKEEIKAILIEAGCKGNDSDVQLCEEIIQNGLGSQNSADDFLILVEQIHKFDSQESLIRELFDSLDKNHDGVLQRNEVEEGFKELSIDISPEELNRIFEEADANKDEVLQYEEFVKVVKQQL